MKLGLKNVNNSALTTYAYNSTDELTSDSTGGAYTYDQNGNWTKLSGNGSTYQFQYDAENRLTYYQSPSASSSYVYNGSGLRMTETDSGASGEHDYLHDGSSPASGLLVDSNLTGSNLFHIYTPGIDQSDAATGALHLMAEDALGTVRGFLNDNAAGAVTDTFGAFAFGAPRTRTGSDAFSLAWGGADGYQTDANGLVLMGNRVYHVYTGRFLTRDPAGAGSNGYEYADDSPVNEIDPSGLDPATLNGSFGNAGGGDSGSWFDGDLFDSVYSPTGTGLSGRTVTGSTDYYLYEWDKAPGKDWTYAGMTYLFTLQSLSASLSPTTGSATTAHASGFKFKLPPVIIHVGVDGKLAALLDVTWSPGIYLEFGAAGGFHWGIYNNLGYGGGLDAYMGGGVEVGAGLGSLGGFSGKGSSLGLDLMNGGGSFDFNSSYVGLSFSLGKGVGLGGTVNNTLTDIYPIK